MIDGLRWVTVDDSPERVGDFTALIGRVWPGFITEGSAAPGTPVANWFGIYQHWPELQFGLLDGDTLVACGNAIPLSWGGDLAALPDTGWDWAMQEGYQAMAAGRPPRTLCGLSVTIAPERQGQGLSRAMVRKMAALGRGRGLPRLVIPVRPNLKSRYPLTPMSEYARWKDERGLPFDPWLRAHTREGGRILHACDRAMSLGGTVAQWERWTGLDLPASGRYVAPGLLAPLRIDLERDLGVYVEPNLWVVHQ